jgi:hypothetical protein
VLSRPVKGEVSTKPQSRLLHPVVAAPLWMTRAILTKNLPLLRPKTSLRHVQSDPESLRKWSASGIGCVRGFHQGGESVKVSSCNFLAAPRGKPGFSYTRGANRGFNILPEFSSVQKGQTGVFIYYPSSVQFSSEGLHVIIAQGCWRKGPSTV